MGEISWLINICFTIFMVGLFVWDYKTFGEPAHKDFKAVIMSIGVLGTFVGIFVGLMGFDTRALQDSVPLLLDGLKTAFYTSIVGMGLSLALNIMQRAKGVKSSQDTSFDYLVEQARHLNSLQNMDSHLDNIHKQLSLMPSKADILQIRTTTNAMLENNFKRVNTSLQEAINQLALGASKELIGALELVIKDFNVNLQEQFGDNFKELNNAVGRLLSWQENYKQSIEDNQNLLHQTRLSIEQNAKSMQQTQENLQAITAQNISAMEFYGKSIALIEDMKNKGEILQSQLGEISSLGEKAHNAMDNMQTLFIAANEGLNALESHSTQTAQSLKSSLDSHLESLEEHHQSTTNAFQNFLEKSSNELHERVVHIFDNYTNLMQTKMEDMLRNSQNIFENLLQSANTQLEALSKELDKNIAQNIESSTHNSAEFARLREHIAKNNTAIVESLDMSLNKLSTHNEAIMQDMGKGMKNLQDMYLSTLSASMDSLMSKEQEIITNRLEGLNNLASKTDANLNTQYEQVNAFLKKMASEYLKMMQKLTKDSVAIPKDMGVAVIKDFGDMQHNLISHLSNLNAQIQHNSVQLIELYRNVQNILNENIQGNKSLQGEIKQTFTTLDSSLNASMENFKDNYEWFLRRVREILGSR